MRKEPNTPKITNEKEACEIIELATLDLQTLAKAFQAVEEAISSLSAEVEKETEESITIH